MSTRHGQALLRPVPPIGFVVPHPHPRIKSGACFILSHQGRENCVGGVQRGEAPLHFFYPPRVGARGLRLL
jgi:hypothetical protein